MSRIILVFALLLIPVPVHAGDATSVKLDGGVYGAQADEVGPIGGGKGYTRIVTKGDFTVKSLDELIEALSKAKSGQVVFIPGDSEIDCTARVYIEELVLEIPAGVTLASNRGHEGSQGGLISSDALKTPMLIRPTGPDVRITGLRIQGPNPKRYLDHHRRSFAEGRGHEYYYKLPTSDGIRMEFAGLEVDNCEITAFSRAGVYLTKGEGHHVHHCFIHHCQYNGLGYGVCLDVASSLIERNLFDFNRHSIAGTGQLGCGYEARHNVELGTSLSHCFDMHGGRDRKDGTVIAGTTINIHHNTFRAPNLAIKIRGVPQDACNIHHNWFLHYARSRQAIDFEENTHIKNNACGTDPPHVDP